MDKPVVRGTMELDQKSEQYMRLMDRAKRLVRVKRKRGDFKKKE